MMLEGGRWHDTQIISAAWIAESTRSSQKMAPHCGLLWWLLPQWRKITISDDNIAQWREAGVKESFIKKVLPLKDRLYERDNFFAALKKVLGGKQGIESWHDNTWRRGLADGTTVVGPIAGYFAEGYLGQYLVVLPDQDLVAVRQMRSPQGDHEKVDSFRDFPKLVQELVGTKALAKSASDL